VFVCCIETSMLKEYSWKQVVSTPALHRTQCGASVRTLSYSTTEELNNYGNP
jgi:hypothetical protein